MTRTAARIVGTFVLALLVGLVAGWRWLGEANVPPARAASPSTARSDANTVEAPGAAAPHGASEADEAQESTAEKSPEREGQAGSSAAKSRDAKGRDAQGRGAAGAPAAAKGGKPAGGAEPEAGVLVPAPTVETSDDDPDLLPRGPSAWVRLDLSAVGLDSLAIRKGAMERDGAGRWSTWARKPIVARLKGPKPVVALLHLGHDRSGTPVVAHVRTRGEPPREGMVSLLSHERSIPMKALAPAGGDPAD